MKLQQGRRTSLVVLLLVTASICCLLTTSATPAPTVFVQTSYLEKALNTILNSTLEGIASLRYDGQSEAKLPNTFASCGVAYAEMQLSFPEPTAGFQVSVLPSSNSSSTPSLRISMPGLEYFNLSTSQFQVNCSAQSPLAAVKLNNSGAFNAQFSLNDGPLSWELAVGTSSSSTTSSSDDLVWNATTANASLTSTLSSQYRAEYTTSTGFALDVFVQSLFAEVTTSIQKGLTSHLASLATPVSMLVQSSLAVVVNPCAVEAGSGSVGGGGYDNSLGFILANNGNGGEGIEAAGGLLRTSTTWSSSSSCSSNGGSIPWNSSFGEHFFTSDLAFQLPDSYDYHSAPRMGQKRKRVLAGFAHTKSIDQCSTCCSEPCPSTPLSVLGVGTLTFQNCFACFAAEEGAATNITFS